MTPEDKTQVKHTTQYHLKQMDKIAKTGEVPEFYKKVFKGIKNPSAHIRAIDRLSADIEKQYHKEHKKLGTAYDRLCEICKEGGKPPSEKNAVKLTTSVDQNDAKSVKENAKPIEPDTLQLNELNDAKTVTRVEKSEQKGVKVTLVDDTVETEPDSEIEESDNIEITLNEDGKQKLYNLKEFHKKFGSPIEEETNEG